MKHLVNLLIGVGSIMGAFGAFASYDRPKIGDRARDMNNLRADVRSSGKTLRNQAEKAEKHPHGSINHRAIAR